MTQRLRPYTLALGLTLGAAFNALGQSPAFTTIDFPGTASTTPWGFNTRGDIVGLYVNADKSTHGFLLSGGQYTTVDFPGATSSALYGINPGGDIVGQYTFADNVDHSFLLKGGQFTKIDFPGAASTDISAINPRGEIVGFYVNPDKVQHGYLLSGDQFTTIDFPGATRGGLSGINPQGDIAGVYMSAGINHAFLLSDGDFTSFDFPGATYTNTTGINARGDIAGRYIAGGVSHGYLLSGGQFSTFDFPGATFTGATGINQRGDTVLGRYTLADGVMHGFLMVGFRPACVTATAALRIVVTAGGAAVTHSSDFTLVTTSKPAAAGEVLSIFATGLGPTLPAVASGQAFPSSPLAAVDSLVEVRVNGRSAIVLAAVGFPGAVDGYQVNFRVPAGTVKGSATIELSAAGVAGTPVNIVVQ